MTEKKSQREALRVRVLDLHGQGIGNSDIGRMLGVNRQRVHDIVRSGRTTELSRGLKSPRSAASKVRASRDATIPPWMHSELQTVIQALRNTAIEDGFRFHLQQQALQIALHSTFELSVPLRTLLRYRFDSVRFQHYIPKDVIGEHQFQFKPWVASRLSTRSDHSKSSITGKTSATYGPGKRDFRSVFTQLLMESHRLEDTLLVDRRNPVQVAFHHHGAAFGFGDIIHVSFLHPLSTSSIGLRHFIARDRIILREMSELVRCVIFDAANGICQEAEIDFHHKLFMAFESALSFPGIDFWRAERDHRHGVTKIVYAFDLQKAIMGSLLATSIPPADMQRSADQMTSMMMKALTIEIANHPALKQIPLHLIPQKRKDLVKAMIDHGWDCSRHPGRPGDAQLLFHP